MERHSRDEQHGDGNDGDEDDPGAHGADRDTEGIRHGPTEDAALVDPLLREGVRQAREDTRDTDQEERETRPRRPARDHARADEGRGAVARQEQREEIARVAESPEEDPSEPDADGADRTRLVEQVQGRVESIERHETEARQRERQDALDLPHPAPLLALGSAARARGSLGGSVSHQTSRTSGMTTGLRSKRWLIKRRTALRTTAPISSRSITSGSWRAARAARTACFTSSMSSSDSFMYTNPRQAISGPATTEPAVL